MPARRPARPRRSRLLLAAVLLVASLLVGEGFLRAFDPFHFRATDERIRFGRVLLEERGGLRRDVSTTYLGKAVTTNSIGMRNPETPLAKPPGVVRLMVLGDSVPFGWGVGDGDEFPRLLQDDANAARLFAPDRCQVINASVPGWGLDHAYFFLKERGRAYEPDIVLAMLINNDVPRDPGVPPRARLLMPQQQVLPAWMHRAWILRLLDELYVYVTHPPPPPDYDPIAAPSRKGVEVVVVQLTGLKALCDEIGARLVLLDTLRVPAIIERCRALGVPRISLEAPPEQMEAWAVSPVDLHPGEEAHRWMAGRVLEGLSGLF